ncbi:MAG: hypothetical protein JKY70_00115 [Mucilaginibacter sp.]|nr:hypothetical protein [Mucilaginibacter sp.]
MNNHQGQIIEYVVRKNGFNVSNLAAQLGINRRTLYNYFNCSIVKPSVISRIGGILRHDFSQEFPNLFTYEEFQKVLNSGPKFSLGEREFAEDELYKEKYLVLLEQYNDLLTGLVSCA